MISTEISPALIRGVVELETTGRSVLLHRLPAWARSQCPDPQLLMVESQPAGVRLVFRTGASVIELDTVPTKRSYRGAPPRPDGVYELYVDGQPAGQTTVSGGDVITIDLATGATDHQRGQVGTARFAELGDGIKDVELWLPHNETTELVALRTDAPIETVRPSGRPVWLHHGSSISHGSNALTPTGTWPVHAALRSGVELTNLGMGGSALLDPFTARTLRDLDADLISVKIGINVVNADLMRLRAFGPAVHGFLDTVREGHPTTPLLVVSAIWCPIHEDTPGPAAPDLSALARGEMGFVATGAPAEVAAGKLTLSVIRDQLAAIVAQRAPTDPNLHYLDGRRLYGPDDAEAYPLPDRLHPDPATHRLIGDRFADLVFADGPFASAVSARAV